MRVLDILAPLHPPPLKRRGKKKNKPTPIERFFKCRMKVPMEPDPCRDPESCRERYESDWAPNVRGPEGKRDEVEVIVTGWIEHYKEDAEWPAYRIAVWGDDDMGMELEYFFGKTTPEEMVRLVLSFPEPLTKDYLRSLGFQYC